MDSDVTSSCHRIGGEEDPVLWIESGPAGAEQGRLSTGTVGLHPSVLGPLITIKALSM